MAADFVHELLRHVWVHPETGVTVACEDMPDELLPEVSRG